jgi:hypothetical protein
MYTNSPVQHFVPNGTTGLGPKTLTAGAGDVATFICVRKCQIKRIGVVVTTTAASNTAAAKETFYRRPTLGSNTNRVSLGDITIPDLTVAGKVVYKDITPVKFSPGEELQFTHTTAATDSSSAAGAGSYFFELEDIPEQSANLTNMLASA